MNSALKRLRRRRRRERERERERDIWKTIEGERRKTERNNKDRE